MSKNLEQALLDRIMYIGDELPEVIANDKRQKFVLLGTPQELIDEVTKPIIAESQDNE